MLGFKIAGTAFVLLLVVWLLLRILPYSYKTTNNVLVVLFLILSAVASVGLVAGLWSI